MACAIRRKKTNTNVSTTPLRGYDTIGICLVASHIKRISQKRHKLKKSRLWRRASQDARRSHIAFFEICVWRKPTAFSNWLACLFACLLACLRVIAAGDCHAAKAARNLRVNSAYQSVVQTIMQAYHMMIIAIYATYFNTFRPQPQPPGIPGGRDEIKAPLPKLNARSIPHPSSRIPFVAPSA